MVEGQRRGFSDLLFGSRERDTIKRIGHHERRIANDIIHKITREIVNRAIETDSLIVFGKLKGLRNQEKKGRGRKFNRKLSEFPYPEDAKPLVFGTGFDGGITDLQVGPDGYLYVLTFAGAIYRIVPVSSS